MRRLIMAGIALPFAALPLLAQTTPPVPAAPPSPSATAPNKTIPEVHAPAAAAPVAAVTPQTTTSGAPGANSFTEGQAQARIEAAGYTNVMNLVQDKDGIWRGTATKDGAQAQVGLDYQGNVVTH
jgi:hypothetical protein